MKAVERGSLDVESKYRFTDVDNIEYLVLLISLDGETKINK